MVIKLRKNASQKSIQSAIKKLKEAWHADTSSSKTYFLEIGGVVRWGYNAGFWSWGYGKNHILQGIAGQKEYAYRCA